MINKKKILAVIPAKGTSKRIKKKNTIKIFKNLRLLDFTFNAIKKSKYIDDFFISTEDKKLKKISKQIGFKNFINRPKKLSQEQTETKEVIFHAIKNIKKKYDIILILQLTSPLRTGSDIDKSLEKFIKKKYNSLCSISYSKKKNKFGVKINKNGYLKRNDYTENKYMRFFLNGAIYLIKYDFFKKKKIIFTNKTGYYLMPFERSLDIDNNQDLKTLKKILKKDGKN